MTAKQPMAFHHEDGLVPAWEFAMKYAGTWGHIATLPEIIQARLATSRPDLPWTTYFTTNSAEYYGIGRDGREKIIIAHGVGPMSTLEGIKKAYSWEYKDKDRRKSGGRITQEEFLYLEFGHYGDVTVIDMRGYLNEWDDAAFYGFRTHVEAGQDQLLVARLGGSPGALDYFTYHDMLARKWHMKSGVKMPTSGGAKLILNAGASNYSYTTYPETEGRFDWSHAIPRQVERGYAVGHLLSISSLTRMHCEDWEGLTSEVGCHEWTNGVRFLGVPAGAPLTDIDSAPSPDQVLRRDWTRFMRPNTDEAYATPRLFLLEQSGDAWFTRYAKLADAARMDESDVEFFVRSVRAVGDEATFQVNEEFFLRYELARVVALAPAEANAYQLVDVGKIDSQGVTTVYIQFYHADVDTSQRLPRVKEIKQDYDLLMG